MMLNEDFEDFNHINIFERGSWRCHREMMYLVFFWFNSTGKFQFQILMQLYEESFWC